MDKLKFIFILVISNLLACTPMIHSSNTPITSAHLINKAFVTPDGTNLPFKTWQSPQQNIKSVLIALHGFNDYSNFFQQPGNYFSHKNTISYAYDQRGFGNTPNRGLWAGTDTYTADLKTFIELIKDKHPDIPLYLLGESMGGAVVIATVSQYNQLPIEGIILVAPAVWGRQTMPWYQNMLLWTLSHTVPWMTLTGKGLKIQPSDNIEMLRELSRDPLIIRATRVESLYGLTNLMDNALSSAHLIPTKTLSLYGEKDEIIPKEPTHQFLQTLQTNTDKNQHMIGFYENGYHMLLRDLNASIPWHDIDTWLNTPSKNLPSGADQRAQEILHQ